MNTNPMVHLQLESWPEWYRLDFMPAEGAHGPRLVISIMRQALERYIDANRARTCSAEQFDSDYLGFSGVYRAESTPDEPRFVTYRLPIPTVERPGKKCPECDGPSEGDDLCFRCGGTGHEVMRDWTEAERMMSLFAALRPLLDTPMKEWVEDLPTEHAQLLSLSVGSVGSGGGCAYIGADLSRGFSDYLRGWSPRTIPTVAAAMHEAFLKLFPSYKCFGTHGFRASAYTRGQLILDVPGDACGLFVEGVHHGLRDGITPFELTCHNVDHAGQVVALLCGLAALAGQARCELIK